MRDGVSRCMQYFPNKVKQLRRWSRVPSLHTRGVEGQARRLAACGADVLVAASEQRQRGNEDGLLRPQPRVAATGYRRSHSLHTRSVEGPPSDWDRSGRRLLAPTSLRAIGITSRHTRSVARLRLASGILNGNEAVADTVRPPLPRIGDERRMSAPRRRLPRLRSQFDIALGETMPASRADLPVRLRRGERTADLPRFQSEPRTPTPIEHDALAANNLGRVLRLGL